MTDLAATGGLDAATVNGMPLKQAVSAAQVDAASVDGWSPAVQIIAPFGVPTGMQLGGSPAALPRRTYTDSLFRT